MSATPDRLAYLQEHLCYELLMLRYTHGEIKRHQPQLAWNALFESFAVHARNLYGFLTDKDNRNFSVADFENGSRVKKTDETIGLFQRLDAAVFHLSKTRPADPVRKVGISDAQKVNDWIEIQFRSFIDNIRDEYRAVWNWDDADPGKIPGGGVVLSHSTTASTATNLIKVVSTS